MALDFLLRRRSIPAQGAPFTPDPFPIEPDPWALIHEEEPAEVIGDEGGGGISAGRKKGKTVNGSSAALRHDRLSWLSFATSKTEAS